MCEGETSSLNGLYIGFRRLGEGEVEEGGWEADDGSVIVYTKGLIRISKMEYEFQKYWLQSENLGHCWTIFFDGQTGQKVFIPLLERSVLICSFWLACYRRGRWASSVSFSNPSPSDRIITLECDCDTSSSGAAGSRCSSLLFSSHCKYSLLCFPALKSTPVDHRLF